MRRGKEIAQACHASLGVILQEMGGTTSICYGHGDYRPGKQLMLDGVLSQWIEGSFTKICLVVNSEQELIELYAAAKAAKLRTILITDSGKTEFNGVPTRTCMAIGPNYSEDIDKITGGLTLY